MPEKRGHKKDRRRFPHEEEWLRSFVGHHGTNCVTRFCEGDLNGISLTRVIEALADGTVISAEKSEGPGVVCEVAHYSDEEGDLALVIVHFVSNEELLTILEATKVKEEIGETDHAA